ncbi:MAG TPA: DNA polymerase III subunit delta', partial [Luteimonas sp.]
MSFDVALAPWQQRMHDHAAAAIDAGRMGHALLFCGPSMLGKRLVAERLAQRVLCQAPDMGLRPCGQCRACALFCSRSQKEPMEQRPDGSLSHPWGHPGHPDAILVGHAWRMTPSPPRQLSVIPVDQVRELSARLSTTPQYGDAKVAIIDPADDMNDAAANALLKTLEEPVPGRYLWLLSANPARLPATIRSRCQRLDFRLPPADEAVAWLRARGHADAVAAEA